MSKKLKIGDKVIVKDVAVGTVMPYGTGCDTFIHDMGELVGMELLVSHINVDDDWYTVNSDDSGIIRFKYHRSWLKRVKNKNKKAKGTLSNKKRIKAVEGRVDSLEGVSSCSDSDNSVNKETWNPKGGDWLIHGYGGVVELCSTNEYRDFGTEFNNEKDAIKASKAFRKYHRLWALALELNDGWEPDWGDSMQDKYYIYYMHCSNESGVAARTSMNTICGIYFRTEELAKKAISILEQENE